MHSESNNNIPIAIAEVGPKINTSIGFKKEVYASLVKAANIYTVKQINAIEENGVIKVAFTLYEFVKQLSSFMLTISILNAIKPLIDMGYRSLGVTFHAKGDPTEVSIVLKKI